jgi:hypothetical protein
MHGDRIKMCTFFHFSVFEQLSSVTRLENGMRFWRYIAQNTDQQVPATAEHVHYEPTNNQQPQSRKGRQMS